jgi:hypothetical protein
MISREELASLTERVATLLEETKGALRGENEFGPAQVRAISEAISRMAPVFARSKELRSSDPSLAPELDRYKNLLVELQAALDCIHVMLLTRRSSLEAARQQSKAVSQWAAAFQQTR